MKKILAGTAAVAALAGSIGVGYLLGLSASILTGTAIAAIFYGSRV